MADTTISSLPQGTPSGNHLLPYSTGNSTLGVPVSAVLQNAGNIGIGIDPTDKLHINFSPDTTNRAVVITDGGAQLCLVPTGGGAVNSSYGHVGYNLRASSNTQLISRNGNNYSSGISFGSSVNIWTTNSSSAGGLAINPTPAITVVPGGNVGIGTTTPTATLEVNGDIKSTTTAKAYAIFDGSNAINTDCTVLKSYNISKIQKMSDIGAYKVTFANSITWPYVPMVTGFNNGTGDGGWIDIGHGNGSYYYAKDPTSTELYILGYTYLGNWQSQRYVSFLVF